jgi:hypothetical protein
MRRLALLPIALLLSTPAVSADLDGPVDRGPAKIVERERIIERHEYYEPPRVYVERRVYVEEPDEYDVPYAYYRRPYRYAYDHWRPRYYFPRAHYWHRHHHRRW